ncbi:MAG: hypothetical protein ACI97A_002961 [Planctomycetota bacterium]|jgi:hypothetical protein
MRAKLLMLTVAFALIAAALVANFGSTQANPSFLLSQTMNDYRIETRLDHVRGVMILEMKNAPPLSRNFIEVQALIQPGSSFSVSYIPVYPNLDGYTRVEIPMPASTVDADYRLTAFSIDAVGNVHQSHFWTLQRRHFNNLDDADAVYGYVEKELTEEAFASSEYLNPNSAMSFRYYYEGDSHLYVSDSGLGTTTSAFTSSGTLYSAAPSLGMRLSAGPAGVFTAN